MDFWAKKYEVTKGFSESERIKILREHPAIAARLFQLKQECLWECVLLGSNQPMGKIIDYWRRIEVIFLLEIIDLF